MLWARLYSSLSYPACKVHGHSTLSPLSCPTRTYFSTLSKKRRDFVKYIIKHKMFSIFYTSFSETFLILRRIQPGNGIHSSSCKVLFILVRFEWILNFLDGFSKNTPIYFRKSVQWELSCSMRKDEQTDMTKLIVAFCNFASVWEHCSRV